LAATPTLTSPSNGATNILYCITSTVPLVFTWSAVSGATSYNIQLDDNADFSSPAVNTSISTNQYSHTSDLVCATQYYWRVRSIDGFGNSPWSTIYTFTTSSCNPPQLAAPTLVSPPNGTGTSINLYLKWNTVPGAIKYKVEVAGVVTTCVIDTTYYISGLAYETWYSWKVQAVNCNNGNPYSDTWSFKTGGPCAPEPPQARLRDQIEEFVKPTRFELDQNYPNPFNPTTRFDYALPEDAHVTLKIYDVLGQELATVVDDFQDAGRKSVEYNAGNLPSGVYFYRLEAGTFTDIKKMLVMK
jgi:hypothetical protein